jgi:hypothetical protein
MRDHRVLDSPSRLEARRLGGLYQFNGARRVHIATGVAISQSEFHLAPQVKALSSSDGTKRLYRHDVHRHWFERQAAAALLTTSINIVIDFYKYLKRNLMSFMIKKYVILDIDGVVKPGL